MHRSLFHLGAEALFVRHTPLEPGRPTLLFIHGLGESGLCFQEAFEHSTLSRMNLVVPDCIGYGASSSAAAGDYSFATQISRLQQLVKEMKLGPVALVGHSLGGILASLWAAGDRQGVVTRLVSIEGNLTAADATFSKHASQVYEDVGRDFAKWRTWFHGEFLPGLVQGKARESYRRYFASLWFCQPEAFLANAQEIFHGSRIGEYGHAFRSAAVPKVFCWGSDSLSQESQVFLKENGLGQRAFAGSSHWPMIDCAEEFYSFLADFVS